DVLTDSTAPALTEFLKELTAIRSPVTAEELAKAKALERQAVVAEMQSAAGFAQLIGGLVSFGLAADTYRTLDAQLVPLTAGDLAKLATRTVDATRGTIVVVGDIKKVRPEIEKLGLGSVEVR